MVDDIVCRDTVIMMFIWYSPGNGWLGTLQFMLCQSIWSQKALLFNKLWAYILQCLSSKR